MKDNFSKQSSTYAKFRPTYPAGLYAFVMDHVKGRERLWDCATGNGQALKMLAPNFDTAIGTDLSAAQLSHAPALPNVEYRVSPAHESRLEPQSVDLITVAQALHWFGNAPFFDEVRRVLKPQGWFAAWGYSLLHIDAEIDPFIQHFDREIIGPFWDPERKHVDRAYRDIEFPFVPMDTPDFSFQTQWNPDQLEGYLNSWSAVQHYLKKHEKSPVTPLMEQIRKVWPSGKRTMTFPIFLKMGQLS